MRRGAGTEAGSRSMGEQLPIAAFLPGRLFIPGIQAIRRESILSWCIRPCNFPTLTAAVSNVDPVSGFAIRLCAAGHGNRAPYASRPKRANAARSLKQIDRNIHLAPLDAHTCRDVGRG